MQLGLLCMLGGCLNMQAILRNVISALQDMPGVMCYALQLPMPPAPALPFHTRTVPSFPTLQHWHHTHHTAGTS
jgi:hypothetical protein